MGMYFLVSHDKRFIFGIHRLMSVSEAINDPTEIIRLPDQKSAITLLQKIRGSFPKGHQNYSPISKEKFEKFWGIKVTQNTVSFEDESKKKAINWQEAGRPLPETALFVIKNRFPASFSQPPKPLLSVEVKQAEQIHDNTQIQEDSGQHEAGSEDETNLLTIPDDGPPEDNSRKGRTIAGNYHKDYSTFHGIGETLSFIQNFEALSQITSEILQNYEKSCIENNRQITDERHYIELYNLNGYEGYMAYKRMQELPRVRRELKDSYEIAIMISAQISKLDLQEMAAIQYRVEQLGKRVYALRSPQSFAHENVCEKSKG